MENLIPIFPLRSSKLESAALTIELRGHSKIKRAQPSNKYDTSYVEHPMSVKNLC
jgi:hypothetical protein